MSDLSIGAGADLYADFSHDGTDPTLVNLGAVGEAELIPGYSAVDPIQFTLLGKIGVGGYAGNGWPSVSGQAALEAGVTLGTGPVKVGLLTGPAIHLYGEEPARAFWDGSVRLHLGKHVAPDLHVGVDPRNGDTTVGLSVSFMSGH